MTLDRVSPEVVIFALFPIRDHRRTRRLKLSDRIPDGFRVKRLETLVHARPAAAMASMSDCGRGMLPMGSVGITMFFSPLDGETGAV